MAVSETSVLSLREGRLYESLEGGRVRCTACAHRCRIPPGLSGVCRVRRNAQGRLLVPWGYAAGLACDPVEKKPFYHLLPGSGALTFGMLGCNFHCDYCQNWLTSQALCDPMAGAGTHAVRPEALAELARRTGAAIVASSYNEPLITAEWAYDVFAEAKRRGLVTAIVSNGYATPEALEFLRPVCDAVKIDLKAMDDRRYRELGGRLRPVLEAIQAAHRLGFWVEVVTLVVPGFNDAPAQLEAMARFVAGVSPDIPWHVTAFHPDYRRLDTPATPVASLLEAARLGQAAGLRYVYVGNVPPSEAGPWSDTHCWRCGRTLVVRRGFRVIADRLAPGGRCPGCGEAVAGVWEGPGRPESA